jgi:hypothetical protein
MLPFFLFRTNKRFSIFISCYFFSFFKLILGNTIYIYIATPLSLSLKYPISALKLTELMKAIIKPSMCDRETKLSIKIRIFEGSSRLDYSRYYYSTQCLIAKTLHSSCTAMRIIITSGRKTPSLENKINSSYSSFLLCFTQGE